jgi:glycerophosphoryl diester phosphodiesterase
MAKELSRWIRDAPLVIAHRGASFIAPENTIPAIKAAIELGADGVELDVKLSKDGVLILHHDQTLDRTTDGSGPIAEWNWSELACLDAGSHHSEQFQNTRIPRLDEIFELFGDDLIYNLELTEYGRPLTRITSRTIELVKDFGLEANVIYSSFNPLELIRAVGKVEKRRIALLMAARTPEFIQMLIRRIVPHSTYHPEDELTTKALVEATKKRGQRINVWTVNNPARMQMLLEWGVDGIITDVPDEAVSVLNAESAYEQK